MAMNKTEQAYVEKLENDIRLAKALRWTERLAPDIPCPTEGETQGFLFNVYASRIEHAASRPSSHRTSDTAKAVGGWKYGGTQGGRNLYSSRLLALRAMRYEVEVECAKKLAAIDKQIENESGK